ncbi:rhamnogalacturonan lyase B N-terminal domain-containing protein [Vibrio ruber]|uniref:rhamnogalacturonan lyase B N-terminal domain-containing protein n=1 Tax=Vibrio ruber TaxID=184755 RepID=UPI002892FCF8|nr:rhamnogalacturonan lyase B N-terminal domain-containing protein [Vibrio ruber]WNJ94800.1 rhamnogalacturonan lyase B N-terminal domain-containing protein [Vibrio ruber]
MKKIKYISIIMWVLAACISSFSAQAAFQLSTSQDFYTVDTNAGVVFSIRRVDRGVSTQSPGDLASLKINGVEYQNQRRGSQINSGFDWLYNNTSNVQVYAQNYQNQYIKITVQAGNLTHYYMARNGYPYIYMATYFSSEPNIHGHVRYILRLHRNRLPYGPEPSDISQTVSTVESGDIFALSNGETRSKHYSNMRLKDWHAIGARGPNVGVWLVRDNHEGGSGGPFYRSLLNQGTATDQEITYIVNYAEAQTEAFRTGVLNHYTLVVNSGQQPPADEDINLSWFAQMGLKGYVPASNRGRVAGVGIDGRDTNYEYTVGFANNRAQYWATANPASGYFSSDNMLPGTYTMTTYKNELAVNTQTVTVRPGQTTVLNSYQITGDPSRDRAIWRIGDWDGSPQEFLNGDKLTTMHPSDVRMANWNPSNFIVGNTPARAFPAYMWKDINNDHIIYFRLNDAQRAKAHRVRIGITVAYAGGRPKISVNNWTSSNPPPPTQPKTRTLTVGTYRGNNTTYTFDVPASAWASGNNWNRLVVTAISGSGLSGYLSAGYSIDSIDLLD